MNLCIEEEAKLKFLAVFLCIKWQTQTTTVTSTSYYKVLNQCLQNLVSSVWADVLMGMETWVDLIVFYLRSSLWGTIFKDSNDPSVMYLKKQKVQKSSLKPQWLLISSLRTVLAELQSSYLKLTQPSMMFTSSGDIHSLPPSWAECRQTLAFPGSSNKKTLLVHHCGIWKAGETRYYLPQKNKANKRHSNKSTHRK